MDDTFEKLLADAQDADLTIEEVKAQLIQSKLQLDKESEELFDKGYNKLYKLPFIVQSLAEPLQETIEPLKKFRNQLADVCKQHDAYLDEIDMKLDALKTTSKNKESCERLISLMKLQKLALYSSEGTKSDK